MQERAPRPLEQPEHAAAGAWRATMAGFCSTLLGIGLARFAYTPLIPAVIAEHWFAPAQAAYLCAANLGGYLAGALAARPIAARAGLRPTLTSMMALAAGSLVACAAPISFSWLFLWRFLAGIAGAVLMVLAAPTILPCVPAARRGLASGVIFTGVGIGIAASGTLVPQLLRVGLVETWLTLGLLGFLLTALSWRAWPDGTSPAGAAGRAAPAQMPTRAAGARRGALPVLYAEYALNAIALVPHMVFLVDFVARGLARGIAIGAAYWVVYGLGAMLGPLLAGRLADRIGFALALRCGLALEAVAVILPAFDDGAATLVLSSAVVGALTPGIVPLALGRSLELAAPFAAARETAWRRATIAFALLQAAAAYLFSAIYGWTGDYALLFELAALAGALAFLLDLLNGLRAPARGVATTTGAARAPRRFRRPSGAGRGSSPPPP